MQVVVLAAGSGRRFSKAGYGDPKPLIKVHSRPMIEYVVHLFPGERDYLFICRNGHLRETNLRKVLRALAPEGKIVGIDGRNKGPVFSLLEAAEHIEDNEPVIVSYCDFFMYWDWSDFKRMIERENPSSSSVCYKGFHPHLLGPNLYAGVRLAPDGRVLEVREKHSFTPDKTETWQQAGVFYFSSGTLLKKYSEKLVSSGKRVNNEYYVSLLYNPMIKDGLLCTIYPVKYFCQWGTPEDLAEYEKNMVLAKKFDMSHENGQINQTVAYWKEFLSKNPFYWNESIVRQG